MSYRLGDKPDNTTSGHPFTKWGPDRAEEIAGLLSQYYETAGLPIIVEFLYLNKIPENRFYEMAAKFPESGLEDIKHFALLKKEAQLEKGGLSGDFNSGIVAFSLKQLGWRDKPQEEEKNDNISEFLQSIKTIMDK